MTLFGGAEAGALLREIYRPSTTWTRAADTLKKWGTCGHMQPCYTCLMYLLIDYEERIERMGNPWAAFNSVIAQRLAQ